MEVEHKGEEVKGAIGIITVFAVTVFTPSPHHHHRFIC